LAATSWRREEDRMRQKRKEGKGKLGKVSGAEKREISPKSVV